MCVGPQGGRTGLDCGLQLLSCRTASQGPLLPLPCAQASAPYSADSASLCFVSVTLGHVPQLRPQPVAFSKPAQDSVVPVAQAPAPPAVSAPVPLGTGWGMAAPVPTGSCPLESHQAHSVPRPLPEVSLSGEHSEASRASGPGGCSQEPSAWAGVTEEHAAGSSVSVSTQKRPAALEDTALRTVRGRPRKVGAGCALSRAGPRGVGRGQLGLCCHEPCAVSRPVSR